MTSFREYHNPELSLERAANSNLIGEIDVFEFCWDGERNAYFWTLIGGRSHAESRLLSEDPEGEELVVEFVTHGNVSLDPHYHLCDEFLQIVEGRMTIEMFRESPGSHGVKRSPLHLEGGGDPDSCVIESNIFHTCLFWGPSRTIISWKPPHACRFTGGPWDGTATD